jgi:hypothetical protein
MRSVGCSNEMCSLGALAILLLLCHGTAAAASAGLKQLLPPVDPASKLYSRMAGLVVPYGYPLEEHFVETVSATDYKARSTADGWRALSVFLSAHVTGPQQV